MSAQTPFAATAHRARPIRLGIIGCGNMGGAFARGVCAHDALKSVFSLVAYDPGEHAMLGMNNLGARIASSAPELAAQADIILLAVKPAHMGAVLADIAPALAGAKAESGRSASHPPGKIVLSIAAGVTLEFLRRGIGGACPVVRVMPNTLITVNEGLFGLCFDNAGPPLAEEWRATVRHLLGALGRVIDLDESGMNAFTALAGSGPAYVFHFMDSLAEAGVSAGLSRESSREIALGLVKGCATLAQRSGAHAVTLREQVSSPGGTTLAALNHLDRTAVRGHLIDAVLAALQRGKDMEKEARGALPGEPGS